MRELPRRSVLLGLAAMPLVMPERKKPKPTPKPAPTSSSAPYPSTGLYPSGSLFPAV